MSNIYGSDVCVVESCCSYMTSPGSREALTLVRFRPTLSLHHEPILEINLSDGFSNLLYTAFFFPILTPMSELFVLTSNNYYCFNLYWTMVMVFHEDNLLAINSPVLSIILREQSAVHFLKIILNNDLLVKRNHRNVQNILIKELRHHVLAIWRRCSKRFECTQKDRSFGIRVTLNHLEEPMAIRQIAVKSFKDKSRIDNDDTHAR